MNHNMDTRKREYSVKKASLYKIVLFLFILVIGAGISLMIPLRPTYSENEKRELTEFPDFSWQEFVNGTYFSQIDTWFADTFPFRDNLIACNEVISGIHGFRNQSIYGEVVVGDEIPDVDIDVEDLDDYDAGDDAIIGALNFPDGIDADDVDTSVEDSDGTTEAKEGESLGSLFIVGDSAYNYYTFRQDVSDTYVGMINSMCAKLEGKATVYSMIVPTSIDIVLDDATRNSLVSSNQNKAMLYMYSRMNKKVRKTYVYNTLHEHRDEYLYFRTDHHWTSLGAYYAYREFIKQTGREPNALDSFEKVTFEGFKGSFYTQSNSSALGNNPDTLIAYKPMATNDIEFINRSGDLVDYKIITNVSTWNATSKYSAFLGGDMKYYHVNNPDLSDGSSCLVIKESYGNAFVPFLVDHFEDVYVIDYRYFEGTVTELVESKGIQHVLLLNNISATSTLDRVEEMIKVCR